MSVEINSHTSMIRKFINSYNFDLKYQIDFMHKIIDISNADNESKKDLRDEIKNRIDYCRKKQLNSNIMSTTKSKESQILREADELNDRINLIISEFEKKNKVQRIGDTKVGFFINLDWI
jgi:hypothetical protein